MGGPRAIVGERHNLKEAVELLPIFAGPYHHARVRVEKGQGLLHLRVTPDALDVPFPQDLVETIPEHLAKRPVDLAYGVGLLGLDEESWVSGRLPRNCERVGADVEGGGLLVEEGGLRVFVVAVR